MSSRINVIIATHNSEKVIGQCVEALIQQSHPVAKTIIVDSGSEDPSYLEQYKDREGFEIEMIDNRGFGAANNKGVTLLDKGCSFVLFINPDTFLKKTTVGKAVEIMQGAPEAAILTGMLEAYDIINGAPTGRLDSTGIFRTWYGRWYDRDMGKLCGGSQQYAQYIPAVCGAFMFCRVAAISSEFPELFDESFFMYKEDIELCIRLAAKGWKFYYTPEIHAYHCRGWEKNRRHISRKRKLMSALNEVKMYRKHPSVYLGWALLKYVVVRYLRA